MPKPLASFAIALSAVAATMASVAPAFAIEVDRQEVAEEFATEVEQQQRVYCRETDVFTLTNGTEYRACVDWRAQNRTRLIRTYASLEGPEGDADENVHTARECFDIAVASANDPYRDAFVEETFLATARAEFARCAIAQNLQHTEHYEVRVYRTGVWLGGSWENES